MKIIHIHVGKCGGGTVNKALHGAGINFVELHCGNANYEVSHLLSNSLYHDEIIITVRDPIARFVSSFNFDKYEKIVIEKTSNKIWNKIYNTFNSAEHLAQSLVSHDKQYRNLAWLALTESYLHMHLGLSWYFPSKKLDRIDPDHFSVIRQEHLVNDFNSFLKKIGSSHEMENLPADKHHSKFIAEIGIAQPKYLSFSSKLILGEVLKEDYFILDYFFEKNLIPEKYTRPSALT